MKIISSEVTFCKSNTF